MNALTKYDFSPLFSQTVGFDRLLNALDQRFENSVPQKYPPYNIVQKNDNEYTVEVAVAGFKENEIEITTKDNTLVIIGKQEEVTENTDNFSYVHRGISSRNFTRSFSLGEYIEVKTASIENGLLSVNLERVIPESAKPKKIEIEYKK